MIFPHKQEMGKNPISNAIFWIMECECRQAGLHKQFINFSPCLTHIANCINTFSGIFIEKEACHFFDRQNLIADPQMMQSREKTIDAGCPASCELSLSVLKLSRTLPEIDPGLALSRRKIEDP